ncbi:MAG TPA: hypothetical protein K8V63_01525 [Brevibacterium linens]|uniref:Uncharacterized protein n=1 Tax=Brevibacterium siliguriense TaxID=1136497 RepID=A0A1H1PGW4_9MICO|nr:hypothetical protein [Brevibacterium siliguriense]WGP05643.1 hypothetical protein QFE97_16225 [Bacillus subtilis]SDS10528.1 hypothetical protein SAMN04489752_0992 [Brevibacterium siliguriense]HJF75415.1 hypothetical protein [Brevibacterium linens]
MKWVKKAILTLVVIFVAFYLFSRPEDSAEAVRTAFAAVGTGVGSLVTFFTSLSA